MKQNQRNVQKEMDALLRSLENEERVPRLLLHSCCAPCSSYVLEYLSAYFEITVLYYNPNIAPFEEYQHRKEEQIRLIETMDWKYPIHFLDCDWDHTAFLQVAKGLENEKEGGKRCSACFMLRLKKAAEEAKRNDFEYFATTLTISPLKDEPRINTIGEGLSMEYDVKYLPSDFKKRGGYQRSIVLSKEYGLYRQDYCGCIYSKQEREAAKAEALAASLNL